MFDCVFVWLEQQIGILFFFLYFYELYSFYIFFEFFVSWYLDFYDGEVVVSDVILVCLFECLCVFDFYDDVFIVFVLDYGEGFMDYGEMEYEVFIYCEILQVLMFFKLLNNECVGEMVMVFVQFIDVLLMIFDVVGVEVLQGFQGRSVLQFIDVDQNWFVFSESVYLKIYFGWFDLVLMIEDCYYFIDGFDLEFYDFIVDFGEIDNIIQCECVVVCWLCSVIEEIDCILLLLVEIDLDVRVNLLMFGYVGGIFFIKMIGVDLKVKVYVFEEFGKVLQFYMQSQFGVVVVVYW